MQRKCHPRPQAKGIPWTEEAEGPGHLCLNPKWLLAGEAASSAQFPHVDTGIIIHSLEDCYVSELKCLYFNCLIQYLKIGFYSTH